MDVGDWASVISAAVSLLALGAASWLSVRAARAAEKSADASRRAAAASEASVSVAVESLNIARKQAEVVERQADKADSPVFRVWLEPVSYFMLAASAKLVDGPHTVRVDLDAVFEIDNVPFPSSDESHRSHDYKSGKLHIGDDLYVSSEEAEDNRHNHLFDGKATVTIVSHEAEVPYRSWRMVQVVTIDPLEVDKWFEVPWGVRSEEISGTEDDG